MFEAWLMQAPAKIRGWTGWLVSIWKNGLDKKAAPIARGGHIYGIGF